MSRFSRGCLLLLLGCLACAGCAIPRTVGKTAAGVTRGTLQAAEGVGRVVTAPLR
jgi:hypothetical protein